MEPAGDFRWSTVGSPVTRAIWTIVILAAISASGAVVLSEREPTTFFVRAACTSAVPGASFPLAARVQTIETDRTKWIAEIDERRSATLIARPYRKVSEGMWVPKKPITRKLEAGSHVPLNISGKSLYLDLGRSEQLFMLVPAEAIVSALGPVLPKTHGIQVDYPQGFVPPPRDEQADPESLWISPMNVVGNRVYDSRVELSGPISFPTKGYVGSADLVGTYMRLCSWPSAKAQYVLRADDNFSHGSFAGTAAGTSSDYVAGGLVGPVKLSNCKSLYHRIEGVSQVAAKVSDDVEVEISPTSGYLLDLRLTPKKDRFLHVEYRGKATSLKIDGREVIPTKLSRLLSGSPYEQGLVGVALVFVLFAGGVFLKRALDVLAEAVMPKSNSKD